MLFAISSVFSKHVWSNLHCSRLLRRQLKCSVVPRHRLISWDQFLNSSNQRRGTMSEEKVKGAEDMFEGHKDQYNGVTIDSLIEPCDVTTFRNKLEASLNKWIKASVHAVWFRVALQHAEWVPVLAQSGFHFHHTRDQHVVMYKWLPAEACSIPPFAHTMIGAGAIVVNADEEILVVKHHVRAISHWKLPGGYVEPNEDIGDAAVREVLEETNIRTEFQFLISFRHTHKGMFDCSDIYFVAFLKPLSHEIKKCDKEIEECQWMKIDDYLKHPEVLEGNRFFVKKFLELKISGNHIQCTKRVHSLFKKTQSIYSISNGNSEQNLSCK